MSTSTSGTADGGEPGPARTIGSHTVTGLTEAELLVLISRTAFAVSLDVRLTRFCSGEVELVLPVTPQLRQHHGFIHGAVIGFAADSACAWAAASVLGDVVTAEYKLNFLAPAVGEQLIGRGSATIANVRNAVCRAEVITLSRGRERLVAMAQATVTGLPRTRSTGGYRK